MPPQAATSSSLPITLLRPAKAWDIVPIHRLRKAAAAELTRQFGEGPWSRVSLISTAERALLGRKLYTILVNDEIAGTVTLTAEPIAYFEPGWFANPASPALYLHSMSVHPRWQRRGIGRQALLQAEDVARQKNLPFIRLDSYDGPASAAGFYEGAGYAQVTAVSGGGVKLKIYEKKIAR